MADITKLTERLKQFEDGQKSSEFARVLWKPREGVQTIRIVPYNMNSDSPFVELKFYYNIGGSHYLAPCTFGKPDPIQEVVETLRSSGSTEEKEIALKLNPTSRTYAPILVRGEEELGVRWYGFGITVYRALLKLMTNSDWGDITSLTEGTDLDVEFHKESKKKNPDGKSFPETNIVPRRNKSYAVDPARKDLMEKLKNQVDILKIFPLKSYDELKDAVNKWLHPEDSNSGAEANPAAVDPIPAQAGKSSTISTPIQPQDTNLSSGAKLAAEFEQFFKK